MLSDKAYQRIAKNIKESGFGFFDVEEDYENVEAYVDNALEELGKALDVQDAITYDGYQHLMEVINQVREFKKNFEQYRIIPLR